LKPGEETTMFEATARLKIRDGAADGFKQQVAEIVALTKEKDTKPLRYDWFQSDDGTECEVHELYVDADALLEQQRYVADAKAKLFRDFVPDHTMTFYAKPSPALATALKAMGTDYTQFDFFQGLDAEANPLSTPNFGMSARMNIRHGALEGFKRQAAEVLRQTKDKDFETLRYDWFISEDATQCAVREGYVDADAVVEHVKHVGEARAKLFHEFASGHDMTLYGEPSPALAKEFQALGNAVTYTKFALIESLALEAVTR
jgi:quinol monooxygenase YgiN